MHSAFTVSNNQQNKAFEFVLEMIREDIFEGKDRSKYIPVYFEDSSIIPSILRPTAKKLPDAITSVMQKLHRVEAYALSSQSGLPIKNDISIPQEYVENLNICISDVLTKSHQLCSSLHCLRVSITIFLS